MSDPGQTPAPAADFDVTAESADGVATVSVRGEVDVYTAPQLRERLYSVVGEGAARVVLDLALIPKFGIVGSSIATLIAQILSNAYLWHTMKSINRFSIMPRLKKVAGAGIAMGITTVILLLLGTQVVVNVVASGVIYVFALKLLKDPLFEETLAILPFFKKSAPLTA